MKILGITGLIGSGKDTVADYLCANHNFKRMSFAATLKDAVASVFNWDRQMLEGSTKESREWREQVDQWWSDRLEIPNLTPRWVLQQWGTEVCRKNFHNDVWVASVENKLRNNQENIVITDCRFPNELEAIKRSNGITARVYRGPEPEWYKYAKSYNTDINTGIVSYCKDRLEHFGVHASEYSSVGLDYDYHLDNDSTLEHLYSQVDLIVNL